MCRMCYPKENLDETRVVQLKLEPADDMSHIDPQFLLKEVDRRPNIEVIDPPNPCIIETHDRPYRATDGEPVIRPLHPLGPCDERYSIVYNK